MITIKLKLPKIKIIGVTGNLIGEEIEDGLRRQNKWIQEEDMLKVNSIKQDKNK